MDKFYLILLSASYDRDAITGHLDSVKEIKDWIAAFPSAIAVKTSLTAKQLSQVIRDAFGTNTHLITEITPNYWGSHSKEFWAKLPISNNHD